jgi:hypothetical protein
MSMRVEIPDDLAKLLLERADATGTAADEIVLGAIRRSLELEVYREESVASVRKAFADSDMTEDEAVELFEAEKHAMRRGE